MTQKFYPFRDYAVKKAVIAIAFTGLCVVGGSLMTIDFLITASKGSMRSKR